MKKIPQLDAVRGLAVLVVMVHNLDSYPSLHLWPLSRNGWMGVDLFFVLSGFLITGILLESKQQESYFKNFYARRCLRIWPLYYAVLFFMFVVVPIIRPSEAHTIFDARSAPWWSYLVYLQNFLVPVVTRATGPLGVTWSLAIEEQFYLVWPLVVQRCSTTQLRRLAIVVICLSPVLRYYLSIHQVDIYSNVFCRLDGLMAGALLALGIRSKNFVPLRFVKTAWIALLFALPLAVLIDTWHQRWIVFSLVVVASSALVYLALFSAAPWFRAIMTNRFLVFSGTISYGLYLLEKLPGDAAKSFHLDRFPLLAFSMSIVGTYALAILSWNLLEKPFLRLKQYFDWNPSPVEAGSLLVNG
jgi:peptidoglycan/LPS O-acetylase OafA/YrhL